MFEIIGRWVPMQNVLEREQLSSVILFARLKPPFVFSNGYFPAISHRNPSPKLFKYFGLGLALQEAKT